MRLGMGLGLGNLLSGQPITGLANDFSFNFDGSNDYLLLPADNNFGVNDTWSVSFWFKSDSISTTQALFSASKAPTATNRIGINLHGSTVRFSVYGTFDSTTEYRAKSSTSLSSDTWYHLVATNSNGTLGLYINNVEQTGTSAYSQSHSARRVIGAGINFSLPFDGLIDEFAIWNTVLDANTIAKLSSKPLDVTKYSASNLKLWLRCGDASEPESTTAIARQDFYTDFDGTDDYVDCGDGSGLGFSGADAFSITAWINPDDVNANQIITAFGSDTSSSPEGKRVAMFLPETAKPSLAFWDSSSVVSDATISANEWVHLAITFAGGNRTSANTKIYIDGVSQTLSGGTASALDLSDMDFHHIGADQVTNQEFNGAISNVGIYKTVLDAQTISQMAKSRFTPMRNNRFSVVDFDGSDDRITTNADSTRADATYTYWAKFPSGGASEHVFGHGSATGTSLLINVSDMPLLYMGTNRYRYWNDVSAQDDNQWHHWAIVMDSSSVANCKLYIDGVEITSIYLTSNSGDYTAYSTGLQIGGSGGGNAEGSMAQFAVYSDLKDSDFISAQYQKGITADYSNDTNLSAYYRMGDDTSKAYPTIADSSSNSNDGTITNGASDDIVQQMVAGYDLGAFESSSEELGAEKVLNSDFSDGENLWNLTNASVVDGVLDIDIGAFTYYATQPTDSGGSNYRQYESGYLMKIVIVVDEYTSGSTIVYATGNNIGTFNSAGTHTIYYKPSANEYLILRSGASGFEGKISSVSIKRVLQSEVSDTYPAIIDVNEPVLGVEASADPNMEGSGNNDDPYRLTAAEWSYDSTNNRLQYTKGGSGVVYQYNANMANSFVANQLYRIKFTIGGLTSGVARLRFSAGNLTYHFVDDNTVGYANGTHYAYFTTTGSGSTSNGFAVGGLNTSGSSWYFTELSFKPVQGNVGTMTNFDNANSGDIMYGSVLPDQSFLTGVNSAYNFIDLDGSDELIDCGDINEIDSASVLSISAWIKCDVTSGNHIILSKYSSLTSRIEFLVSSNSLFVAVPDGSTMQGLVSFTDTGWNHVAVIFDGSGTGNTGRLKIYLNGENQTLSYNGTIPSTLPDIGSNVVTIGGRSGSSSLGFNGGMGQVSIFNKAISEIEVNAINTAGRHSNLLDSYSDNLLGYWAMGALDAKTGLSDVGDGTIYDRSGNSNHGTATNTESADLKSSPNAEPNGYAKGDTNRSTTTP